MPTKKGGRGSAGSKQQQLRFDFEHKMAEPVKDKEKETVSIPVKWTWQHDGGPNGGKG
jgi:hypothetical protein